MSGFRVLVTRPQPACHGTAARVQELGMTAIELPVTEIVRDGRGIEAALAGDWSAVALTSANAVFAAADEIHRWHRLPAYAVGRRTGDAARQAGFTDVRVADGEGVALAGMIGDDVAAGKLFARRESPLLYLAGRPRASDFEKGLADASVPFSVMECYVARPVAYDADVLARTFARPIDCVLFYSRETARAFFRLIAQAGLRDQFRVRRIVCLSDKVVTGLPAALRDGALVATSPSEAAILELLAAMRE